MSLQKANLLIYHYLSFFTNVHYSLSLREVKSGHSEINSSLFHCCCWSLSWLIKWEKIIFIKTQLFSSAKAKLVWKLKQHILTCCGLLPPTDSFSCSERIKTTKDRDMKGRSNPPARGNESRSRFQWPGTQEIEDRRSKNRKGYDRRMEQKNTFFFTVWGDILK